MAYGDDSNRIRKRAWEHYIEPRIRQGATHIALAIKPLMKEMESEGFPTNHPRQFCKALQKKSFLEFLKDKGLVLDHVEGPPSGTSTTVVLHLRVIEQLSNKAVGVQPESSRNYSTDESADGLAESFVQRLKGLLKNELAEYGGAEGFMRWIRSEEAE